MKKQELSIMRDIAGAMEQTEVWFEIMENDPRIKAQEASYNAELHRLIPNEKETDDLQEAFWGVVNAYITAAILYGVQVAQAIHDVSLKPDRLNKYILDRMNGK